MDIHVIQSVFNKGELTPKLHARVDSPYYRAGLQKCKNFHVLVQGGLNKRSGSRFVSRALIANVTADQPHGKIIPFIFSEAQTYGLEFGHYRMGLLFRGGIIESSPGVRYTLTTPYPANTLHELTWVQSADIVYLFHPDYPTQKLQRFGETNWTITPAVFYHGPFMDVNTKANAVTPVGLAVPPMTITGDGRDFNNIKDGNASTRWSHESGDGKAIIKFDMGTPIALGGYAITSAKPPPSWDGDDYEVWSRIAPKSWTFEASTDNVNWIILDSRRGERDWLYPETRPYYFKNDTLFRYYRLDIKSNNGAKRDVCIGDIQFYFKNRAGTITFQNTTGVNTNIGLNSGDIGRLVRVQGEDGFWRIFKITGVSSPTAATGTWDGFWVFGTQNATQTWALGAFSVNSGFPRAGSIFQERLCMSGTKAQPRTVFMSASGDYENFELPDPLTSNAPITVTLSGGRRDAIQWTREIEDMLMCGTTDSILSVGGTENNVLSPTNIRQRRHAGFGTAENVYPVRVGSVLLFVGFHRRTLHELVYSAQLNGYDAPNISVLADHLYLNKINRAEFSQTPNDLVYMCSDDGTLTVMTYEREQQVVGHGQFIFVNGLVKDICVVPEQGYDTLYMIVQRTINNQPVLYVEQLQNPFESGDISDAWFLDSALNYDGAATNVITGLSHLDGQLVKVFGWDETATTQYDTGITVNYIGDQKFYFVSNGQIELDYSVTHAVIGLPFASEFQLLKHPIDAADGSTYGRKVNVAGMNIQLIDTLGLTVMSPTIEGSEQDIVLRKSGDTMDEYSPLFTGTVEIFINDTWSGGGELLFKSDEPFPVTVTAINTMVDREPGQRG